MDRIIGDKVVTALLALHDANEMVEKANTRLRDAFARKENAYLAALTSYHATKTAPQPDLLETYRQLKLVAKDAIEKRRMALEVRDAAAYAYVNAEQAETFAKVNALAGKMPEGQTSW